MLGSEQRQQSTVAHKESKQVYHHISHDFTKSLQPFNHVKGIHTTIPADNFFPWIVNLTAPQT